ncbi:transmembrane protein, putative (macronuclear) [Tetrahymena thermophila SB210]|uniref:Transmembrane protein, putative n=1 Tax=Tetrahymena thermophila (strain SB210) TaxID=312017 RepID=Q23RP6_TETTS|nr:transmembrane protein, putative [Tetrahymena thermophila SB210]EAR99191.2 transmembrane protein, putative [Tetrahymena thermophila SB210]|eukprot:XP_001019436.2 transmembrane protein, putative [Tetrahymena thermophila SB210]
MLRFLTFILVLILQKKQAFCIETITTHYDSNQLQVQVNLNVGSPPVPLALDVYFGTVQQQSQSQSQLSLGQYIFDQSIQQTSPDFYELLSSAGIEVLYDTTKSSTSQLGNSFQRQNNQGTYIQGVYVNDILSFKSIQGKYNFACVQQVQNMYSAFSDGQIIFNRIYQNLFDQLYQQNAIKTSDYILRGSQYIVHQSDDVSFLQNSIEISFDLDKNSSYYDFPSNPMINNIDTFEIMNYGIYLDGQDVTDKVKTRKLSFDQINSQRGYIDVSTYIPKDLFNIISMKYNLPPNGQSYSNCKQCQCQEVANLPEIALITEQYKITIQPNQYMSYRDGECNFNLISSDSFNIAFPLMFNNINIMYQKSSNSIKLINAELINHLNLNSIIATFSIFSAINFISLIYFSSVWLLKFKLYKSENLHKIEAANVFEINKNK